MQNPIAGMENFTIEHTNLGTNFLEKFHYRLASFDLNTSKHIIKYLCLSMFFYRWVPNSATLAIKIFNHFIKKHLIKSIHVILFQNF